MKLDRIEFAMLISYIAELRALSSPRMAEAEIARIDQFIDIEAPAAQAPIGFTQEQIKNRLDQMLIQMNNYMTSGAGHKIEAIKLYRELTGAGLKESKDMIEGVKGMTIS